MAPRAPADHAGLSVAVGVTAAALGGYIVPARDQASLTAAAPGNEESPNTTEPQPAAPSSGANVVLVPVASDLPAVNPVQAEPELLLARYEAHEREEHRGRSRDHREEHDDGDEHDDD
ncbi:MAG: hypothetical protein KF718_21670 [Polyangiaceae bacterium]|nr:hypothetical protein [Polyangiaceae bacterium]